MSESTADDYDLAAEYDLSKLPVVARGRYVPERRVGTNVVLLDPDVAEVFPSDEAVNAALRQLMKAAQLTRRTGRPTG